MAAPSDSESRKRRRSESAMTGPEDQADKRLKSQQGEPVQETCPFDFDGQKKSCKTQRRWFAHFCQHLQRDHGFRRGPPRPDAKRHRWLAMFDVNNPLEHPTSPILCLVCGKAFLEREDWSKHNKEDKCIRSERSKVKDDIKKEFAEYVMVNAQQYSNDDGAPDTTKVTTKVSSSSQTMGEFWKARHLVQVMKARSLLEELVHDSGKPSFQDHSREDQRILEHLETSERILWEIIHGD